MAAIDVAGYVADLKDHSVDHGFHVHDERHFVETYSLRQVWEVDLHPEEGCGGPLDLHLALDVDPRVLLSFEDAVMGLAEDDDPPDDFHFPLTFTWALPPLPNGPDLLRLAIDLAGVGGIELPLEVSAIDSFASATDGSGTTAEHRGPPAGLPGPGAGRRGAALRRLRSLPRRQPLPARRRRELARLTCDGGPPVGARASPGWPDSPSFWQGCSNSGLTLARQACTHVERSIRLYAERRTSTAPSSGDRPTAGPLEQLEAALPLGGPGELGRSASGTRLMTTLQEVGRNSEAHLVPPCAAVRPGRRSSNEQAPVLNHIPGQPTPSTLPDSG